MSEEKKKFKNLATYSVTMVLAVVVIIIFAAMADNRESDFESRLNEKENINITIQNEIVSLKDENYELKNQLDKLQTDLDKSNKEISFYKTISEIMDLCDSGNYDEAAAKLAEISSEDLNEDEAEKIKKIKGIIEETD